MKILTISSRQFNQNVSGAKRAAISGPVFITDRGQPAHVLLSIKTYEQITAKPKSMVELLAMPNGEAIEFDPPRLGNDLYRPEEFF